MSFENFMSKVPVIGTFFESDAEKNLQRAYADMQAKYQAYRPVAQQAHMTGLQNVLDPRMLGPIQAQLAKMYGGGAAFDPSVLLRDPLAAGQAAAPRPAPLPAPAQAALGVFGGAPGGRPLQGPFSMVGARRPAGGAAR